MFQHTSGSLPSVSTTVMDTPPKTPMARKIDKREDANAPAHEQSTPGSWPSSRRRMRGGWQTITKQKPPVSIS